MSELRGQQDIDNRNEFKAYCMRQLGHPVITVNVSDEQVDDRIDDALQLFFQYHIEGTEEEYRAHKITQEDIDRGYLLVSDDVYTVTNLIDSQTLSNLSLTNLQVQWMLTDIIQNVFAGGLSNYVLTKSYLATLSELMGNQVRIKHNFYKKTLKLTLDLATRKDQFIIYKCYTMNDTQQVYNNNWLKQYATALIRKQWGNNLIKMEGVALPGGGTLNGGRILDQATQEIEQLETKLWEQYTYPVMAFMG